MRLIERRVGLVFALFLVGLGTRRHQGALARRRPGQHAQATPPPRSRRRTLDVPARRGAITDRNGEELAVSQPAMSVAATPYLIRDPLAVAQRIAPILRRDQADVLEDLSKKDTGFV